MTIDQQLLQDAILEELQTPVEVDPPPEPEPEQ